MLPNEWRQHVIREILKLYCDWTSIWSLVTYCNLPMGEGAEEAVVCNWTSVWLSWTCSVEMALNVVLSSTVGKEDNMLGAVFFKGLRLETSRKQVQGE